MTAILSIVFFHMLLLLAAKNLRIKNYLSYLIIGFFSLLIVISVVIYLFTLEIPRAAFEIYGY